MPESTAHQTLRSGQEAQPHTERLNVVSHNVEKLKLDWHNRGGFSDLGALSKFQVWGPNTINMCSFKPNPYFACSLSLFIYPFTTSSQPESVLKPY